VLGFRKLRLHERPIVLLNLGGFFDPLLAQVERAIAEGFDRPELRDFLRVTDDPERGEAERRRAPARPGGRLGSRPPRSEAKPSEGGAPPGQEGEAQQA
jgi:predicted Rossmann-fold nucleotide-binding protein